MVQNAQKYMNFNALGKLLFYNTGHRQTILKNTFWLAIAEGVNSLLKFALIVYVARALGASEYGKFSFAFAFVSLFAVLGDLGLSHLMTREFSGEKEKEKEYPAILLLKLFLSAGVLFLTFVSSFFAASDRSVQQAIWILMFYIFLDGFFSIIYPFLRARQKMEYEAIANMAQTTLTVIIGFLIIFNFPSAVNLSYAYLLATTVVLATAAAFFHFFVYFLKFNFDTSVWIKLLKNSWPLTFGFVGAWMYLNLNSVMIGFLGPIYQVGWYDAAGKVIFLILIGSASLISKSFYPALSKFFKESKTSLQENWNYFMEIMVCLALPLMFGGMLFSSKIIDLLYGLEKYSPSVFILQALIIAAGITFLYYPYSILLIVAGEQRKNFLIMLAGVIINVILNFILIPRYGFYAAPINTIISSIITFLFLILSASRHKLIKLFDIKLLKIFLMSLLSSIMMFFIASRAVVYNLNVIFAIILGMLSYCAIFFILQKFVKIPIKL